MKKCILLVRVSTEGQDYDEQQKVIYEMALNEGYLPENIISIADKESAIKLSEEERHGLNVMKEYIKNDKDINAIYCFELDRISRKKKILFSVVDFLVEHHVNLIIKEPNRIELLNVDGTINEASEMIITLFAQLAESEMRNKLARFKRSKNANKSKGKYIGGNVTFGYFVNEDGYLEIDPNNIVGEIFAMYATGNFSYKDLAQEFQARGYFSKLSIYGASKRICLILNRKQYYGEESNKGMVAPAIVTKDLFDKCKAISVKKQFIHGVATKKQNDKTCICKGLMKCTCGWTLFANKSIDRYICVQCNLSIKKSVVDSAIWFLSAPVYGIMLMHKNSSQVDDINSQIKLLNEKIKVSQGTINELRERIDKLDYAMFVTGKVDTDKGDRMKNELNRKVNEELKTTTQYRTKIQELEQLIKNVSTNVHNVNVDEIYNITDTTIRYDILHEIIEKIVPIKLGRRLYELHIHYKTGMEVAYKINIQNKKLEVEENVWLSGKEFGYNVQ